MYRDQFGEFVCGYWGLKDWAAIYYEEYTTSTLTITSSDQLSLNGKISF